MLPNKEKKVGVVFASDNKSEQCVRSEAKTSIFHVRNIAKVSPYLLLEEAETLMHALIASSMCYCNTLHIRYNLFRTCAVKCV